MACNQGESCILGRSSALPKVLRLPVRRALMTFTKFSGHFFRNAAILAFVGIFSPALFAQGPLPESPSSFAAATGTPVAVEPSSAFVTKTSSENGSHKFWDAQNRLLFVANAAGAGADFAVTRANLQSGGQELNPVVRIFGRSTAGLAVNFAGEAASVVALSYFFHRTGHHRLERAVSFVNIGSSAGAVAYGLTHR